MLRLPLWGCPLGLKCDGSKGLLFTPIIIKSSLTPCAHVTPVNEANG